MCMKKFVFLTLLGPEWVSINRGVLICDECCSVHRSLGRHISQVRHLRLAPWHPTLLSVRKRRIFTLLRQQGKQSNFICNKSIFTVYSTISGPKGPDFLNSDFFWKKSNSFSLFFGSGCQVVLESKVLKKYFNFAHSIYQNYISGFSNCSSTEQSYDHKIDILK